MTRIVKVVFAMVMVMFVSMFTVTNVNAIEPQHYNEDFHDEWHDFEVWAKKHVQFGNYRYLYDEDLYLYWVENVYAKTVYVRYTDGTLVAVTTDYLWLVAYAYDIDYDDWQEVADYAFEHEND